MNTVNYKANVIELFIDPLVAIASYSTHLYTMV